MKLYATITSERATKGQGGNKFLRVELMVGDAFNPEIIGAVELLNFTDETYNLRYYPIKGKTIILGEGKLKGKKQKGKWQDIDIQTGKLIPRHN